MRRTLWRKTMATSQEWKKAFSRENWILLSNVVGMDLLHKAKLTFRFKHPFFREVFSHFFRVDKKHLLSASMELQVTRDKRIHYNLSEIQISLSVLYFTWQLYLYSMWPCLSTDRIPLWLLLEEKSNCKGRTLFLSDLLCISRARRGAGQITGVRYRHTPWKKDTAYESKVESEHFW